MGGRPSPVRHLDEDGHIFGLQEVREERDSHVPRNYGNKVPDEYETISYHQLQVEVRWRTAPREPPRGTCRT